MNAIHTIQPATPTARPSAPPAATGVLPMPARHVHRERDFGVGYGNSSGYASPRRYADSCGQPRFRCG